MSCCAPFEFFLHYIKHGAKQMTGNFIKLPFSSNVCAWDMLGGSEIFKSGPKDHVTRPSSFRIIDKHKIV